MRKLGVLFFCFASLQAFSQASPKLLSALDQQAKALESKVIDWRRHFHQNPELSNREFKTGAKIAEHLKSLGLEVRYPVAKTGAVGILRTGKPGPVLALRADIDGLPVVERNSLPLPPRRKANTKVKRWV